MKRDETPAAVHARLRARSTSARRRPRLAMASSRRGLLVRIIAVIVAIQAVVSGLVVMRSRIILRRIAERRPPFYPSREFPELELERSGDRVQLHMDGRALLADIIEAIDSATERVMVETFIWIDDDTGGALRDALARAADRGVQVYCLYDWVLSDRSLEQNFFPDNIHWSVFRPLNRFPSALHVRNLLRDHRKIVVVDGTTAYLGGYNFGDEYRDWRDTHLRLSGASAGDVENAFIDFWNAHRGHALPVLGDAATRSWEGDVAIHRNDPSMGIFPIRGMYLEAIDRAQERIWITNAYFVPDRSFLSALITAAHRGVDVRVMLPKRSNHSLTDALAHGMFEDLLTAGIRVFLYRDFMVHAKTITIDGRWTSVGTANLDRWSMLGNYEINAEVRSEALAGQMESMFVLDMESCEEVDLPAWQRRPVRMKASERTLRALAPLM